MMPTHDHPETAPTTDAPLEGAVLRPSANIARIAGIAVVGVLIVILMGYKLQRLNERWDSSGPQEITLPAEYRVPTKAERELRRAAAAERAVVAEGAEAEEAPEPAPEEEAR